MKPEKPEKPEFVEGDKRLRLNLYLFIAAYLLLAVLLEPLIDFLLMPGKPDPIAVMAMGQKKQMVATYVYSLWRMPPVLFFLWFGWRVIASLRLPPAGMRFPFSVQVIKGKPARMFGILMILMSLLLLYRELLLLVKAVGS